MAGPEIERALRSDRLIDITTIGRKSGKPHRIEIAFHTISREIYISGMPGRRDWYANLLANPDFIFHLKQTIQEDIPARATPITDPHDRRRILTPITQKWGRESQIDDFVARSPLVRVELKPDPSSSG
jgi:hypothetical protein